MNDREQYFPTEDFAAQSAWVRRLARRLLDDHGDADDLSQDAWLVLHDQPSGVVKNPRAWLAGALRRIARRTKARQSARRQALLQASVSGDLGRSAPSTEQVLEAETTRRMVVDAVLSLEEPYRSNLLLHFYAELGPSEIARRLDVPASTVRTRLQRGLARVRSKLGERDPRGESWMRASLLVLIDSFRGQEGALGKGILVATTSSKIGGAVVALAILVLGVWWSAAGQRRETDPAVATVDVPISASPDVPARTDPLARVSDAESGRAGFARTTAPVVTAGEPHQGLDATLEVLVEEASTKMPVPDARIVLMLDIPKASSPNRLRPEDQVEIVREKRTNEAGKSLVTVPSGITLSVVAQHEDAEGGAGMTDLEPLSPGERRQVIITLRIQPDVRYFLRCLARADHTPIAGARASLVLRPKLRYGSAEEWAKRPEFVTEEGSTSDEQGLIGIEAGSWRLLELRIEADGFVQAIVFPTASNRPEEALTVLLDRESTLQARVVDSKGLPVRNVRVDLRGEFASVIQPAGTSVPTGHPSPVLKWSETTGADGVCLFEGLPSHTNLRPRLTREGVPASKVPDPLVLEVGEARSVEWRLGQEITLSGRVLDDANNPVPGVPLWLVAIREVRSPQSVLGQLYFTWGMGNTARSETSDADGRYRFGSVAPGRWWLGPSAERGATSSQAPKFAPLVEEIVIPEGVESYERDLIIRPALFVQGRVLDPEGGAVRTRVDLTTREAGHCWSGDSLADGSFEAGPVSDGEFLLRAYAADGYAESDIVAARAGQSGVVLTLRAGASLRITVVDDATGEVLDAQPYLIRRGDAGIGRHKNSSADRGIFQFDGLVPGVYDIAARASDGRIGIARTVALIAGDHRESVVRVSRGARLRIRCEGDSSWGVFVVRSGEAEIARSALERGAVRVEDVVPGAITVEYTPSRTGITERRELELIAAEDREIVFRDGP